MVKTEWVSGIDTDEEREAEIQSCFTNKVEFHSVKEPKGLIDLIEKSRTRDIVNDEKKRLWRKNYNGSSYCNGRRLEYR